MDFDGRTSRLRPRAEVGGDKEPLIIDKQPPQEWFKDQGGKKAALELTVRSPVALTEPVALSVRVLLENGTEPPDQDRLIQVEALEAGDLLALDPKRPKLSIRFKILKVREL